MQVWPAASYVTPCHAALCDVMPHYGITQPQSDYINSNMTVNLYVQADISRNENCMTLYDERKMGKDKDTLCSLRLKHHVENFQRCKAKKWKPPDVYIFIHDNCVGHDKSNVTLQCDYFMAMLFYKRVMFAYLIPGH